MKTLKRSLPEAALLILAAAAWTGPAHGMESCEGTYAAMALHPLPAAVTVGLESRSQLPSSQTMAERLIAGLRTAGVAIGADPSVSLRVSTARFDPSAGSPDTAGGGASDLSGLEGGVQVKLPDIPAERLARPPMPSQPPMLFMRVEATPKGDKVPAWVMTLQCRITGTDDGRRAEDLGHLVGTVLGKRVERAPF